MSRKARVQNNFFFAQRVGYSIIHSVKLLYCRMRGAITNFGNRRYMFISVMTGEMRLGIDHTKTLAKRDKSLIGLYEDNRSGGSLGLGNGMILMNFQIRGKRESFIIASRHVALMGRRSNTVDRF